MKIISFLYGVKWRYFLYESYSSRWGLQIYSFEFLYLRSLRCLKNNIKFQHRINRVQAFVVLEKSYLFYTVSNGDTFYIKVVVLDENYNFIYSFKFFHFRLLSSACDMTMHV
jgi:hypothetical protein